MGSATSMFLGVVPATTASAAPGDASLPQGMDLFAALLASLPVAPAGPPAASGAPPALPLQTAPASDEDATTAESAPLEISAMIAGMLLSGTPAAAVQPAASPQAGVGEEPVPARDATAVAAPVPRMKESPKFRIAVAEAPLQAVAMESVVADAATVVNVANVANAATVTDVTNVADLADVAEVAAGQVAATLAGAVDASDAEEPVAPAPKSALPAGMRQLMQALAVAQPAPPRTQAAPGISTSDVAIENLAIDNPASQSAPLQAATPRAAEVPAVALPAMAAQQSDLSPVQAQAQATAPSPAAMLAASAPTHATPAATGDLPATLHNSVGTPRWADELGTRIALMSLRGQQEGSLNLTPEHLGPLEVRVSVNQNTANVWFGAQHADTRAALAEALPRLRELMADAGLVLGHAGVSHEAPRQGPRDGEAARAVAAQQAAAVDGVETSSPALRRVALGLVDTYA